MSSGLKDPSASDSPATRSESSMTVQRVVLPLTPDGKTRDDVLVLYVERGATQVGSTVEPEPAAAGPQPQVVDRRSVRVRGGGIASFGTYFNAFPAAYWQQWTDVDAVDLVLTLSDASTVTVFRSAADGTARRVAVQAVDSGGGTASFRLPIEGFEDGGWYWFDVHAGPSAVVVQDGEWRVRQAADAARGGVTIGVTTFNRPREVVDLLRELGGDPTVLSVLDEVLVVDQGSDRVVETAGFEAAARGLEGRLRLLEQANLGGSGGFSRSMHEVLEGARSDYVLLLDDDVVVEAESVLRASAFADLCRTRTIVGGHMFNLLAPTRLHSLGEQVASDPFDWGPAEGVQEEDHDFADQGLRTTAWMHRRVDVDYTGWWMCLIPVEVLKTAGLSLPFFIKWDDAEFGLRAGSAGFPSVSLPGAAIWHMPWAAKDDVLDWQGYFYQRNRLITALLHGDRAKPARIVRDDLLAQLRHLVSMQYSAADLRLRALDDVLSGPAHLHRELESKLPEVRAARRAYPDATLTDDLHGFERLFDLPQGKHEDLQTPPTLLGKAVRASDGLLTQFRRVRPEAQEQPEALVPTHYAYWWRLALLDSALVPTNDRSKVRRYQRDRKTFALLLARSVATYGRVLQGWPTLQRRYRAELAQLASPEAWQQTFATQGARRQ